MIHLREEGELIRQGFNFYPRKDMSMGCQMLFGPVRVEARYSKRTKRFHFGMWVRSYAEPTAEEFVYVPGQTEQLEALYKRRTGKPLKDWKRDEAAQ